MQALRGVLHDWVDLEVDWTSVPPFTRPIPNQGATQRYPPLQPPCQIEKQYKLFVFNNYIYLFAVHFFDTRKFSSHRVNLVDTGIPME